MENVNFKNLKELYLNNNNISDISIFKKVEFKKLELLNISNNEIDIKENDLIILGLNAKIKYVI